MKRKAKNIIELSSGIGNQMFQYAFGYSASKKAGRGLILDPFFVHDFRKFLLDRYKIDYKKRLIHGWGDYLLGRGPRRDVTAAREFRDSLLERRGIGIVKEDRDIEFTYVPEIISDAPTCYRGYWQDWRYFDEYYEDIKRQFTMRKPLSAKAADFAKAIEAAPVSVSLHIRRTDYVTCDATHWVIDEDYYRVALEYMQEQLGDFELFIFSDDREYVKENFRFHDFTLIEGTSDLEDLALMNRCRHHILANSTFSWWGAYLGADKGGTVVAPVVHQWTREFYLPQWHCVEL